MSDELIHRAQGPGLPDGEGTDSASPGEIFYAETVGVEIPSKDFEGKHLLVRDSHGNVGIIWAAVGNVLIFDEWHRSQARIMLNPTLIGQTIAMLHEFCIILGVEEEMTKALDGMRHEVQERTAGLDTKDFI